jgi:glycine/D-amino acid oxidase-like deaminating enzyme
LLSQNNYGELIIGDSHHYGNTLEPFDSEEVNRIILNYFHTFFQAKDIEITERWNGTYPKIKGQLNLISHPEKDVMIVNGLGGAGMTLSFGLAEKVISGLY